jgi:hypothetical protein
LGEPAAPGSKFGRRLNNPGFLFTNYTESMLTEIQPKEVRRSEERGTISGEREDGQASLRILEAATEFEELRDTWSAWSNCPGADPDFFSIHLRHRRGVVRPHVMVVYRSGRPDCMLVGWLDQGPVTFKVGPFALCRCNARILRFVAGGFLGNQSWGNSRLLMREIIKSLQNQEALAVEFSQLKVGSLLHILARTEPSAFCRELFTPVQTHRYLALRATFDEYFRGLSLKSRKLFKVTARMLVRDFPGMVRFQSIRSEREVEDFARMADEISRKTYQRAVGEGFVDNVEMREMLRTAAQNATLRACLLFVGERPIAFAIGFLSHKTLYGTFTGYDPEFKKYSPGLQSVMRLIEESFEPSGDLLRVDAGSGDLPYKRRLFDSSWKEHPVWIFAPSANGFSLHVLRVVSTLVHSFAMRLLEKSEYLRRVRKMWHQRALREFQQKSFAQISR